MAGLELAAKIPEVIFGKRSARRASTSGRALTSVMG
jgi:hypothetical protein